MLDTSKPNVLNVAKDKGDPAVHLRSEEGEEQDQVVCQTTHGEEGAHHHRGHEELHVVEDGTSTVMLESPKSPSSGKTMTRTMSRLPRIQNRIFRGGRAHQHQRTLATHPEPKNFTTDQNGLLPIYTLTPDSLLALLETRQDQTELCQQVQVWTQRHTGGVRGSQKISR